MLKKTAAVASKRATWHLTLVGMLSGIKTVTKETPDGSIQYLTFWVNNKTRWMIDGEEAKVDLPGLFCRVQLDSPMGQLISTLRGPGWCRCRVGGWLCPMGDIEVNENGYLEAAGIMLILDAREGFEVLSTSDNA